MKSIVFALVAALLSAHCLSAEPVTKIENVPVLNPGGGQLEPFSDVFIVVGGDGVEQVQGVRLTVVAAETAVVSIATTKPVEYKKDGHRFVFTEPGMHRGLVTVVDFDNRTFDQGWVDIPVPGDGGTDPDPDPPTGFDALREKSYQLSKAVNVPERRSQFGHFLLPDELGTKIEQAERVIGESFSKLSAIPLGVPRGDWLNGWWLPITKDIKALVDSGKIDSVSKYREAWEAVVVGLLER